MKNLYRKEVLTLKKDRLMGEVLLTQPFSYKLLFTAMLVAIAFIIFIFLNGEYSRKEKVRGYITTDKGIIKIYPGMSGVLSKLFIQDGQQIKKGEILASVYTAKRNANGDNLPAIIIRELNKQKRLVRSKILQEENLTLLEMDSLKKNKKKLEAEKSFF